MLESLSTEELQFIKAIEKYKTENSKQFLSWSEVLKIFKDLGYQKVAKRTDIVIGPTKQKRRKKPAPAKTTAETTAETAAETSTKKQPEVETTT